MNLNKIFSKAALVLAGRHSMAELDKQTMLTTFTFVSPADGKYTSAVAQRNADNTWNVSTLTGDAKSQSTLDASGRERSGDIAKNVSLDNAVAAMKKFEADKFDAGMRTHSVLYCINPFHYATYKSAIARKNRLSGPQ